MPPRRSPPPSSPTNAKRETRATAAKNPAPKEAKFDAGKTEVQRRRARPSIYEINWINPVSRQKVGIKITHTRDYLIAGTDHVEVQTMRPKNAPLPITETGYRSSFIERQQLSSAGGPVTFVESWLARECASKDWRRKELSRAQGDLFKWADARTEATARPARRGRSKTAPNSRRSKPEPTPKD